MKQPNSTEKVLYSYNSRNKIEMFSKNKINPFNKQHLTISLGKTMYNPSKNLYDGKENYSYEKNIKK